MHNIRFDQSENFIYNSFKNVRFGVKLNRDDLYYIPVYYVTQPSVDGIYRMVDNEHAAFIYKFSEFFYFDVDLQNYMVLNEKIFSEIGMELTHFKNTHAGFKWAIFPVLTLHEYCILSRSPKDCGFRFTYIFKEILGFQVSILESLKIIG